MSMHLAFLFLLTASSANPADTVRQSLIDASDRWFFGLVASSIIVGIGVCLEAPESTIALRRWYLHWRKRDVPPENGRSLAIPASYLGLLLVILGVIGEGVFESLSSTTETALRAHDEQVLAATITQAGNAAVSSERANTAAGQAEYKADGAEAVADKARGLATGAIREADSFARQIDLANNTAAGSAKTATEAEEHLAGALREAAQAEQQALQARKALDVYTSPRTLNPSQQANIATQLKLFGPMRVDVIIVGDSPEIGNLTSMIMSAMGQAGWSVKLTGKAIGGPNAAGVFIGTHTGTDLNTNNAANALIQALRSAGIATGNLPQFGDELPMAIVGEWDGSKVAPIRLIVCSKP